MLRVFIGGRGEQRGAIHPTEAPDGAATRPALDGSDPLALPLVATHEGFPNDVTDLPPEETVVLLNVFTTWRQPCQEEMPAFRRLRAAYDSETLHVALRPT